jgi:hypothetical protein
MREITRTRLAAQAKSRRATPEELREAKARLKEIETELTQLQLLPETKNGEEREKRYDRVLRLREMRDEFESRFPIRGPRQPNSLMLALVMTVASFLTCAACGGGLFFAYNALTQKPAPTATGDAFWADMEAQNYSDIRTNLMSATLRVGTDPAQFNLIAGQADKDYGFVTSYSLTQESGDLTQNAALIYHVTRTKQKKVTTYYTTLKLSLVGGSWVTSDYGAAISPTSAGVAPVSTSTPNTTTTPTGSTTPTGRRETPGWGV